MSTESGCCAESEIVVKRRVVRIRIVRIMDLDRGGRLVGNSGDWRVLTISLLGVIKHDSITDTKSDSLRAN